MAPLGSLSPPSTLLQSLQNPALYNHPVHEFQLIETHISWVLLTGSFAYKIKKPVDLGFVDFSSLERRQHFCAEELRLNRRLAPDMYAEVIAISGSPDRPHLDGRGPAIEYAVKMKQFSQRCLLWRVLEEGQLTIERIDALAKQIANFHHSIQVSNKETPFGTFELLAQPVKENFDHLPLEAHQLLGEDRIQSIRNWSEHEHASKKESFLYRKAEGFIRECHGDLHLGNMALINQRIVIFDCIEFSDRLRWIDVMSEMAFVVMDLIYRGQLELAYRLLNAYLEYTGDYVGLSVFRYYLVYRAMVRAKVAGIRLVQETDRGPHRAMTQKELNSYLMLAERLTRPAPPSLIIMHGLSGSGKTIVSQIILEALGAIRIRSDIERKRLFGLSPEARTEEETKSTIYGIDASQVTYNRLEELAAKILDSGFSVIVDATFLKKAQRQTFKHLAGVKRVPFMIIDVTASEDTLRNRVKKREQKLVDASEATVSVLEQQLLHQEPIAQDEQPDTFQVKNDPTVNSDSLKKELLKRMGVT